jgi:large subunit ribosomal protein L14
MIQKGSYLTVVDNSGAKKVSCIRINASCKKRYAKVGEIILVSVKSLRSRRRIFSKVKKGEIFNALILRTKKKETDFIQTECSFLQNSVVLLTRKNKLVGTRIFGGVSKKFRFTKFMRILSISSGAIY